MAGDMTQRVGASSGAFVSQGQAAQAAASEATRNSKQADRDQQIKAEKARGTNEQASRKRESREAVEQEQDQERTKARDTDERKLRAVA